MDSDIKQILSQCATSTRTTALTAGTWDYADNDTLGFSTIYVRLSDGADPDSKADGYVQSRGCTLNNYSEGTNYSRLIRDNLGLDMVQYGQVDIANGTNYTAFYTNVKGITGTGAYLAASFIDAWGTSAKIRLTPSSDHRAVVYVDADPGAAVTVGWMIDVSKSYVGYY
jgi:hypothetical protein